MAKTPFGHSVYVKRKDLLIYFQNEEDAKYVSQNKCELVKLKCPICGNPKEILMNTLTKCGFTCLHCSQKDSYPNRFMNSLLSSLNIRFEREVKFEWSNNRRYDFYVKDLDVIIEMHGEQHYTNSFKVKDFEHLEKQKEVDFLKRNIAIKNGVIKYFEINCSKSKFHFIKQNIINSGLLQCLNVEEDNVDWEVVENNMSKTNKMLDICNLWNDSNCKTITEFSKESGIFFDTASKYIRMGLNCGIAREYSSSQNSIDALIEISKSKSIPVHQYDLLGNYISEFKSAQEVEKLLGFNNKNIQACCKGRKKTVGGFKWSYVKDYI